MNRMNIKKCTALFVLIAVFTLIFAGCGAKAGQDQAATAQTVSEAASTIADSTSADQSKASTAAAGQQASTSTSTESAADQASSVAAFPLKVTDGNGFEMTISSEPQKIVSLTLGSDEMLLGLVDKSRVIALTKYADDAGISNISAEAAVVPNRVAMDKLEGVIALNPDLVILDTWADAKAVKQLRDAGITVYAFKTPSSVDGQKATISELAHITGADAKGKEMLDWMDAKLKDIESRLSTLKPEEKLTVMDYGEMGSSGKGTNFDDIVTSAGLVNVVSRAGMEGWPTVSKEKIIEWNPDLIVLPSWYYDKKNSLQGMKDTLKNDKSLQTVKAISSDRLISVPNPHISAISQYVVLGVEDLAKAAYPKLFQ